MEKSLLSMTFTVIVMKMVTIYETAETLRMYPKESFNVSMYYKVLQLMVLTILRLRTKLLNNMKATVLDIERMIKKMGKV